MAEALEIGRVIIPFMNGGLSAVGLAISEVQHDYVKTIAKKAQGLDPEELLVPFLELQEEGLGQLEREGIDRSQAVIEWSAEVGTWLYDPF